MKISELSKATGVSQRMLRYFEEQGLLKPSRTSGDYRTYGASERSRSLRDLRERVTGNAIPVFEERVAYSIPGIDVALAEFAKLGWKNVRFDYLRFGEWSVPRADDSQAIGELIWQSSFYFISASLRPEEREAFMAEFCRCANETWRTFDGHPPREIDPRDLGEFFSPNDIIVSLDFESDRGTMITLVLPYAPIFTLAKSYATGEIS
jgi:hypothetical protein